jgi:hypothetical protein
MNYSSDDDDDKDDEANRNKDRDLDALAAWKNSQQLLHGLDSKRANTFDPNAFTPPVGTRITAPPYKKSQLFNSGNNTPVPFIKQVVAAGINPDKFFAKAKIDVILDNLNEESNEQLRNMFSSVPYPIGLSGLSTWWYKNVTKLPSYSDNQDAAVEVARLNVDDDDAYSNLLSRMANSLLSSTEFFTDDEIRDYAELGGGGKRSKVEPDSSAASASLGVDDANELRHTIKNEDRKAQKKKNVIKCFDVLLIKNLNPFNPFVCTRAFEPNPNQQIGGQIDPLSGFLISEIPITATYTYTYPEHIYKDGTTSSIAGQITTVPFTKNQIIYTSPENRMYSCIKDLYNYPDEAAGFFFDPERREYINPISDYIYRYIGNNNNTNETDEDINLIYLIAPQKAATFQDQEEARSSERSELAASERARAAEVRARAAEARARAAARSTGSEAEGEAAARSTGSEGEAARAAEAEAAAREAEAAAREAEAAAREAETAAREARAEARAARAEAARAEAARAEAAAVSVSTATMKEEGEEEGEAARAAAARAAKAEARAAREAAKAAREAREAATRAREAATRARAAAEEAAFNAIHLNHTKFMQDQKLFDLIMLMDEFGCYKYKITSILIPNPVYFDPITERYKCLDSENKINYLKLYTETKEVRLVREIETNIEEMDEELANFSKIIQDKKLITEYSYVDTEDRELFDQHMLDQQIQDEVVANLIANHKVNEDYNRDNLLEGIGKLRVPFSDFAMQHFTDPQKILFSQTAFDKKEKMSLVMDLDSLEEPGVLSSSEAKYQLNPMLVNQQSPFSQTDFDIKGSTAMGLDLVSDKMIMSLSTNDEDIILNEVLEKYNLQNPSKPRTLETLRPEILKKAEKAKKTILDYMIDQYGKNEFGKPNSKYFSARALELYNIEADSHLGGGSSEIVQTGGLNFDQAMILLILSYQFGGKDFHHDFDRLFLNKDKEKVRKIENMYTAMTAVVNGLLDDKIEHFQGATPLLKDQLRSILTNVNNGNYEERNFNDTVRDFIQDYNPSSEEIYSIKFVDIDLDYPANNKYFKTVESLQLLGEQECLFQCITTDTNKGKRDGDTFYKTFVAIDIFGFPMSYKSSAAEMFEKLVNFADNSISTRELSGLFTEINIITEQPNTRGDMFSVKRILPANSEEVADEFSKHTFNNIVGDLDPKKSTVNYENLLNTPRAVTELGPPILKARSDFSPNINNQQLNQPNILEKLKKTFEAWFNMLRPDDPGITVSNIIKVDGVNNAYSLRLIIHLPDGSKPPLDRDIIVEPKIGERSNIFECVKQVFKDPNIRTDDPTYGNLYALAKAYYDNIHPDYRDAALSTIAPAEQNDLRIDGNLNYNIYLFALCIFAVKMAGDLMQVIYINLFSEDVVADSTLNFAISGTDKNVQAMMRLLSIFRKLFDLNNPAKKQNCFFFSTNLGYNPGDKFDAVEEVQPIRSIKLKEGEENLITGTDSTFTTNYPGINIKNPTSIIKQNALAVRDLAHKGPGLGQDLANLLFSEADIFFGGAHPLTRTKIRQILKINYWAAITIYPPTAAIADIEAYMFAKFVAADTKIEKITNDITKITTLITTSLATVGSYTTYIKTINDKRTISILHSILLNIVATVYLLDIELAKDKKILDISALYSYTISIYESLNMYKRVATDLESLHIRDYIKIKLLEIVTQILTKAAAFQSESNIISTDAGTDAAAAVSNANRIKNDIDAADAAEAAAAAVDDPPSAEKIAEKQAATAAAAEKILNTEDNIKKILDADSENNDIISLLNNINLEKIQLKQSYTADKQFSKINITAAMMKIKHKKALDAANTSLVSFQDLLNCVEYDKECNTFLEYDDVENKGKIANFMASDSISVEIEKMKAQMEVFRLQFLPPDKDPLIFTELQKMEILQMLLDIYILREPLFSLFRDDFALTAFCTLEPEDKLDYLKLLQLNTLSSKIKQVLDLFLLDDVNNDGIQSKLKKYMSTLFTNVNSTYTISFLEGYMSSIVAGENTTIAYKNFLKKNKAFTNQIQNMINDVNSVADNLKNQSVLSGSKKYLQEMINERKQLAEKIRIFIPKKVEPRIKLINEALINEAKIEVEKANFNTSGSALSGLSEEERAEIRKLAVIFLSNRQIYLGGHVSNGGSFIEIKNSAGQTPKSQNYPSELTSENIKIVELKAVNSKTVTQPPNIHKRLNDFFDFFYYKSNGRLVLQKKFKEADDLINKINDKIEEYTSVLSRSDDEDEIVKKNNIINRLEQMKDWNALQFYKH